MSTRWIFWGMAGFFFGVMGVVCLYLASWNAYHIDKQSRGRSPRDLLVQAGPTDRDAEYRGKGVRILCWIVIHSMNFSNRSMSVKRTWTKRCDIILFFSSETDPYFPTIGLKIPEGRAYLPQKSFAALMYIYKHHYDDADWFLKADDDTYVIMENLRHFLRDKDTTAPYYYGQVFRNSYNSGGAGYVIGKEGLRRFGKEAPNTGMCTNGQSEDVVIGQCLAFLGVMLWANTEDTLGRPLFNWNNAYGSLNGDVPAWAKNSTHTIIGLHGVSNIAVSFHYVKHPDIQYFEFFLNNLTVHGFHRPVWPV
ncbi:glycoprotein-N-acetylgalactosamine 3-beta-galactosyltransferase 1-like [Haliotis rufescens]|uniref:glycoprotein-N-acetylgalactosamine 3-beta-galactosyltransferase 1-like n=1 Tax=Haliotis rufescens TaxID=6454 RepID=UPI00201F2D42|nr:glycoprotein-N-acetylgalactosamine 3-beta-galactosyltransferase 1-like [Haliotis rufescens]